MSWLFLVLAILFEISGTTSMKLSEGFTRPLPSVLVFVLYSASLSFLVLALKTIDLSVAYAIWSAVGTALIATIGMIWFREPATALKLLSLALIIAGVVGLHLSSGASS